MVTEFKRVYRISPYKFDLQKDADGLVIGYSMNEIQVSKYLQIYDIETGLLKSETFQGVVYIMPNATFEKLHQQYKQDFINGDTSLALSEQQGLKTKLDTLSSQSIDDISTSMKSIKEYQKNKDENMFGKDGYYTKKNALGQDKTDREIDGHKQEYDPVTGHKVKLDKSFYYAKHAEQFKESAVKNSVDEAMYDIMNELEHPPTISLEIPEVILSDGSDQARAFINMVNIYRVSKGLDAYPVSETIENKMPATQVNLHLLQRMEELKNEGKTVTEIISTIHAEF